MEKAFNLFLYSKSGIIAEIGYVVHPIIEDDAGTLKILKEAVEKDCIISKRLSLDSNIADEEYFSKLRLGTNLELFEKVFQLESAVYDPLVCITVIVDGKPRVDLSMNLKPFRIDDGHKMNNNSRLNYESMDDYLTKYISDAGFDLPRLIHDDYFVAIKLLRNNGHLISTMKLLLSCIDTLAYVDFGDIPGNFNKWLNEYSDLSSHGINEAELWELRNSLLHMSNLSSRRVLAKKHPSIIIFTGNLSELEKPRFDDDENCKFLNLDNFLETIYVAISNWCKSFQGNPKKIELFVTRYDLIVSDSRLSVLR